MYHGNFRAQVNTSNPESFAICDRCGELWSHNRLQWQWDWQGVQLVNLQILVCPTCLDVPFLPGKVILIPPDPVPIRNPRPPSYAEQSSDETYQIAPQPQPGLHAPTFYIFGF